jgi:trans-aconitate methyltransferase
MSEEKEKRVLVIRFKSTENPLEFDDKNYRWEVFYDDRVVMVYPKTKNGYIMVPFESIFFIEEGEV